MEDTRQCCNPFPCPYIGKDKTCEECNCYREDFWDESEILDEQIQALKEFVNNLERVAKEYAESQKVRNE